MEKVLYLFGRIRNNKNLRVKVQSDIKIFLKKLNSTFYNNLEMP